eukprot:scaffold24805_cov30-Phaeocystis_antarctica.AAC.1
MPRARYAQGRPDHSHRTSRLWQHISNKTVGCNEHPRRSEPPAAAQSADEPPEKNRRGPGQAPPFTRALGPHSYTVYTYGGCPRGTRLLVSCHTA